MKRVFSFGNGVAEGAGLGKETLGGKGAGLAEMTALGIPVPPGFTIETSVCADFSRGASRSTASAPRSSPRSAKLEHDADKRFGDPKNPLLVSVRSGARSSMPGHDGHDPEPRPDLAHGARASPGCSGERFALDCRRRFLEMYCDVVLRVPRHEFEKVMTESKKARGVTARHGADGGGPGRDRAPRRADRPPADRPRLSGRPARAALGRDRRGLPLLGQRAREDVPQAPPHPRRLGHGRQRAGDGLRQPRRDLRHGRRLHARPGDGREEVLRRVPAERPGRGRRRGHPDAAAR